MDKRAHLVYLPPLTGLFFHEAGVYGGHYFVELLTGNTVGRVVDMGDT